MTNIEAVKNLVDLYALARQNGVWDTDKEFAEAVAIATKALAKDGDGNG